MITLLSAQKQSISLVKAPGFSKYSSNLPELRLLVLHGMESRTSLSLTLSASLHLSINPLNNNYSTTSSFLLIMNNLVGMCMDGCAQLYTHATYEEKYTAL